MYNHSAYTYILYNINPRHRSSQLETGVNDDAGHAQLTVLYRLGKVNGHKSAHNVYLVGNLFQVYSMCTCGYRSDEIQAS